MWAGDQRQKLFRNLEVLPGDILLSAVTAPGADCLPWDERACAGLGEHKHSGKLGCRVREMAAARWNREAPGRWRRLHRRAYQDTVKRLGRRSVFLVTRVWEIQARGVLHVHPVLAYGTARQMAGARAYLERLAELAPRYGFGFVERKVKPQPAVNAAAYLSSYFVKGKRGKQALWESVQSPAMPRSIIHVSTRLTQKTIAATTSCLPHGRPCVSTKSTFERSSAPVSQVGAPDCLSTDARRRADAYGRKAAAPASAARLRAVSTSHAALGSITGDHDKFHTWPSHAVMGQESVRLRRAGHSYAQGYRWNACVPRHGR